MTRHVVTPRTPRVRHRDWDAIVEVALGMGFICAGVIAVLARDVGWVTVAAGVMVLAGYLLCVKDGAP